MSTRPVPTNLDSWPGVTDLVGSYKHILHVLWSSPPSLVNVVGVGRPGVIERLTGATRLDEPVVLEALRELDRRGLVALDEGTREVGIRRWCAYHKFVGRWAKEALRAYGQIESAKIKGIWVAQEGVKALFPAKSNNSSPTAEATSDATPRERSAQGAPGLLSLGGDLGEPNYRKTPDDVLKSLDGVVYQAGNVRDEVALASISNYPPAARAAAVADAAQRDKGGVPWASGVLAILRAAPDHHQPPPLSEAANAVVAKRRAYGLPA